MAKIMIYIPDGYLATATVDGLGYTADPTGMTQDALLHVFEYGFQRIVNDKTGGKDADEKKKAAEEAIARLTASEYVRRKVREGGGDPLQVYVRRVLRDMVKLGNGGKLPAAYRVADDKNEWLDAIFEKQSVEKQAHIRGVAEKEKAAEEKAKAEAEKRLGGIELTL